MPGGLPPGSLGSSAGGRFTTIPVIASTDSGGGALPHIAIGGGWRSTIELVNIGSTNAQVHLKFFTDDGSPLPISLSSGAATTQAAAFDQTLAPHQDLAIQAAASDDAPLQTGSAQLSTDSNVSGFIRFGYVPQGEEAIVPLEPGNASAYILPFDNTGAITTGTGIQNLGSSAANIPSLSGIAEVHRSGPA